MPLDLLPKTIRAYVEQEAELSGVDEGGLASACLSVVASAVADRNKLQVKEHDTAWVQRACIWTMNTGVSSTMKTPILRAAAAPLKDIQGRLFDEHEAARQIAEMKDEGEAPPTNRHIVNDTTFEALLEIWKSNEQGVLAVQDELDGWITSFDRYSPNGNSSAGKAGILSSWNGEAHTSDRITRGTTHVKNASMCVVGGIQPDMIAKRVDKMGNDGLMPRFFHSILRPAGRGADRARDARIDDRYRHLISRLIDDKDNKKAEARLHKFDKEARVIVDEFLDYVYDLQALETQSGRLAEWCGKLGNQMARLALTLHYAETDGVRVPLLIPGETAYRAVELIKSYYLPHAIRFFTEVLADRANDDAMRWIADFILARGLERITFRDLDRGGGATKNLSEQERRRCFRVLDGFGWVQPEEKIETICKAWRVNPAVHALFAERAEFEKARRDKVRRVIAETAQKSKRGQDE